MGTSDREDDKCHDERLSIFFFSFQTYKTRTSVYAIWNNSINKGKQNNDYKNLTLLKGKWHGIQNSELLKSYFNIKNNQINYK